MELSAPFLKSRPRANSAQFATALQGTAQLIPAIFVMKTVLWTSLFLVVINSALADVTPAAGVASWYGEDHRGRLMANGKKFNPDRLTAASWFYPLGTKVRVSLKSERQAARSVLVTITDRGPSKELVRDGRIIDLTHAAFRRLGRPATGLISVVVQPLN
jgi:rare lipoprotein A